MNIMMYKENHNALTGFLYGLTKVGFIQPDTPLAELYYCLINENFQGELTDEDREFIIQKIDISKNALAVLEVWLEFMNLDTINVYCNETAQLLAKECNCEFEFFRECLFDNRIYNGLKELKHILY